MFQVITGEADISIGGIVPIISHLFDFGTPTHLTKLRYISRLPRRVTSYAYGILLDPLELPAWAMTLVTIMSLSAFLFTAHKVYTSDHLDHLKLAKPEGSTTNFIVYPMARITEPDPLPWFTSRWSAGRMVTLLWIAFSFLMNMFYACNLRAHLIVVTYEKPIDTLEDIVKNGQTVYIYDVALRQRYTLISVPSVSCQECQVFSLKNRLFKITSSEESTWNRQVRQTLQNIKWLCLLRRQGESITYKSIGAYTGTQLRFLFHNFVMHIFLSCYVT